MNEQSHGEQTTIRKRRDYVLSASIGISVLLLSVNIFRWTLVDWLTVFLEPFIEMAVYASFLGVSVWSLIYFVRKRKTVGKQTGFPLLINASALLIVLFVPFTAFTTKLDFYTNYSGRMKVVSEVLDGKMGKYVTERGGTGDMIHLPEPDKKLSSGGGDIFVYRREEQTLILFFSFRGILRSFSGFVYATGKAIPQDNDFGENFFEIEKLRPNWYWVASKNW